MEQRLPFSQQLKLERESRNWSQDYLAEKVGTDTKTVQRWERGETLPRPDSCERLCTLFNKTAEEFGLLKARKEQRARQSENGGKPTRRISRKEGMVEAPSVKTFYGREQERADLEQWVVGDRCQVVAVLGIGGIGKSTLVSKVVEQVEGEFDAIFWASLQDAPPPEMVIGKCLRFLAVQQSAHMPETLSEQLSLLLSYLQEHRCLLILDNLESILRPRQSAGEYREGYEHYGRLIQRIGEVKHRSCLLLTSRETPTEVALRAGKSASVRILQLAGMGWQEGRALLGDKDLTGSDEHWAELVAVYSGNPLALKMVSEPIQGVYGGDIGTFLQAGETTFRDINTLLEQQFQRLSPWEQGILYWLAIEREAMSLSELRTAMLSPTTRGVLLDALASLQRRSMIEKRGSARFTLQPVIMDYVIGKFIERACQDGMEETFEHWRRYAFIKAHTRDYVREAQLRLILDPIAEQLLSTVGRAELEQRLRRLVVHERQRDTRQASYAAGNILNLYLYLGWDLRGADFSQVTVRQAYLQGAALPHINFAHAHIVDAVFTSTFGNVPSVAFDPTGSSLALGTSGGDIWLYSLSDTTPALTCRGHTDGVWSLSFSPDGQTLASSSDDGTIGLWDISEQGAGHCTRMLQDHRDRVRAVAFSPDGRMLVSGSDDKTVRVWDVQTSSCLRMLHGHSDRVWSVAFNKDGSLLVTGSTDQTLRIWDMQTGDCLRVLSGHTASVRSVGFSPDGKLVVSGGDDQTVCVWESQTGACLHILHGHSNRVWCVDFSPDGRLLASSSEDHTIRLWNTTTWRGVRIVQGHTHGVRAVRFNPAGDLLASGGDDQTCRTWEVSSGNGLRTLQGYTNRIWSIAFHPTGDTLASCSEDGSIRLWDVSNLESSSCFAKLPGHDHGARSLAFSPQAEVLASGGEDQKVHVWDVTSGRTEEVLPGHSDWVRCVAFSADGRYLASASEDQTVRLWERSLRGGTRGLHILRGHNSWVRSVAFHPQGTVLASGGDDSQVLLWDVITGHLLHRLPGHTDRVRAVAFSPDGVWIASGSEDYSIRLWDARDGQWLKTLTGHSGRVLSVAFNADSRVLASGGVDRGICLWDITSGECICKLEAHTNCIRSLVFSPNGRVLASGSDDGTIRLWDVRTHQLQKTLVIEKPYEQMNIAHVTGLTEAQRDALYDLGASKDHSPQFGRTMGG